MTNETKTPQLHLAYLTSQYPATSHTFIRREVSALRRAGLLLDTFSIRRPSPEELKNPETAAEYASTFYVLPISALSLALAHLRALLRRPWPYMKTLWRAERHRVPGLRAFLWSFFHFAEAMVLADQLERRKVTHLHNHFANSAAIVGMLAAYYLDIGFSLTLHGISEFDYPAGLLLREKIEASRFVFCVSYFGRAQAQRVVPPEQWGKLLVARCGVESEKISERRPRASGRLRFLNVGRLSAEKGQIGLVEAFAESLARGTFQARLDIIGEGPERARIEEKIQELGISDRCALLGRKTESEVLRELESTDAFVLSSFMEGLPVVLLEAMTAGIPVIAPSVAGIPELVDSEQTGLLFSPSNWAELADRIERLATDAPLRERLGRAGRERVVAEFDQDRAVAPILDGLLSLEVQTPPHSILPPLGSRRSS